jgi:hypothetical protein
LSIKIMSHVWASGPENSTEVLVLLALADFCNDDGECWPSMATIARKTRMSERGVQKVCARLCEGGWLTISHNSGRKGCNLFVINPRTTFTPEPRSPRTTFAKPPNPVHPTPEPGSPEPSRTIKEPSEGNTSREIEAALSRFASPDAARSFIAYRRKIRKALTITAARRIATQLEKVLNGQGDPDDALGMAEEKGWQSVQADWYFNAKTQRKPNGTTDRAQFDAAIRETAKRLTEGTIRIDYSSRDPFAAR